MIFRNKALKTTAAAIAIISMVGAGSINYVHADSSLANQGVAIERTVKNENKIEYGVVYIDENGNRLTEGFGVEEALMVLDGTTFEVESVNGVKYVVVKFKDSKYEAMTNYNLK